MLDRFSSTLKTEGDYQNHSTEIIIPELPNGLYLIKANTKTKDNVFAVAHIQITDMALVESQENDNIYYQLVNRTNGEPIVIINDIIVEIYSFAVNISYVLTL